MAVDLLHRLLEPQQQTRALVAVSNKMLDAELLELRGITVGGAPALCNERDTAANRSRMRLPIFLDQSVGRASSGVGQ
ncbi:MAG: hypothetical protein DWI12_05350 [Planctomycetota bacterium]|nr:MAG: hypothetical protein DWI12_05350 [Planctomycetota bacterium]